ncbi:MAG: TlpA family protein disulfide reductase [Chitinophagales bacterium]
MKKDSLLPSLLLLSICCMFYVLNTTSLYAQQKMPDFKMPTINGDTLNVADYGKNGKVTIFKFWTSAFMSCVQDLDNAAKLVNDWDGELDIEIVSVNVDTKENIERFKPQIERYGWKFDILLDTNDVLLNKLWIREKVLPYTVILDHKGNIIYTGVGDAGHNNEKLVTDVIKQARSKLPVVSLSELKSWKNVKRQVHGDKPATPPLLTSRSVAMSTTTSMLPKPSTTPDVPTLARVTPPTRSLVIPKPEKIEKTAPNVPTIVSNPVQITYDNSGTPRKFGDRTIATGKQMVVKNTPITLRIWDTQYEDFDTVSLYLNGKCILEKFSLSREAHRIELDFDPEKDNHLIFFAHNEGKIPPNTAAVELFDGTRKRQIEFKATMKSCDSVNLKFVPSKEYKAKKVKDKKAVRKDKK